MAVEILMPKFGLSMEEGTIGAWLVKEGDTVEKGQAIAEVASEKLSNDATAAEGGVVLKLLLEEGDSLPCGEPIAIIGEAGESVGSTAPSVAANPPAQAEKTAEVIPADGGKQTGAKITPRAEKIAKEKGLAWEHIEGTGRYGMITIADLKREGKPVQQVQEAAPADVPTVVAGAPATSAAVSYTPVKEGESAVVLNPMQKAIASGMYQSLTQTAQTTIMTEANVHALADVYKGLKPKYTAAGVKLSYTAMIIKAVAQALEDHPEVRRRLVDENHYTTMENIDIGVAVDVPGGLVVPVIRAANLKDLRTICQELASLSGAAQSGRLTEDQMGGAVITVTNLGMFSITYFTPVLNTPEPCILGCGAIVKKPVVREGGIFADETMNLSLTHDHRIINGAPAARFLQQVVAGLADFRWV